jgi:5-carboxymethyl-2-hydroxymuconate isomerase
MPHITIEYSANLDGRLDIDALIAAVHQAAIGTGIFEPAHAARRRQGARARRMTIVAPQPRGP